jgi:hypothetical protein
MTPTSNWDNTPGGTVVAYFSNGADAQNAINELVDEGFPVDEIGAVFHSSGGAAGAESSAGATSSPSRPRHDEMAEAGSRSSASGSSGAESGSGGVTPAGLATGMGTGFTGAPTTPGPIPGSEIPSSMPSEIPSTLESSAEAGQPDLDASYGSLSASPTSSGYDPTGESEPRSDESWWDKLKHLFSGETSRKREPQSEKGAAKFGTGEGQLGVVSEYDYPYSGSAFESSFSSMGIPDTRARRLSSVIRRGGAIVTVNAESRQAEAENILVRNHGQIREESDPLPQEEAAGTGSEVSRVQVFGRVQRVYPGYISSEPGYISSDQPSRKAS